jgi:hypothetical protein
MCFLPYIFSSIYVQVYVDETFEKRYGLGHKIVHGLFYGTYGLQNLFNLKGLKVHINFEVMEIKQLGYATYPSNENVR